MSTNLSKSPRNVARPFQSLRDEFDQMLKSLWGSENRWMSADFSPACDLSETADSYQVRMDVPGIKPDDITVQVSGDSVRISGERKEEKEEKDKTYHRIERRSGSFCETLRLPGGVADDKVQAEFHDGVLTVTLPKSEMTKSRTVKVKANNSK